jgi:hypothetical protein
LVREEIPNHDYEGPFFKPATEEEDLLEQLKEMSIPVIDENKDLQ